jgi:signal transduction histidine kinase
MTLVTLALLVVLMRLLIRHAALQEERRSAAERAAHEFEKLVQARTRELSALSTHLQAFAEKEKSQLAHNLHDELGGLLTAAKMDLSWVQSRVHDAPLNERLAQLGTVLDEAMDVKRRVVEDLRPSLLDHFGLPTALRAYFEGACAKAGLECSVELDESAGPIPKDVAIALFRVVQEGLTNVIRHAQARRVGLELLQADDSWTLIVRDDGCGFDAQAENLRWSHGISGMRHRVRALGGKLRIESAPGNGTVVQVDVPISGYRAEATTSSDRPPRSP